MLTLLRLATEFPPGKGDYGDEGGAGGLPLPEAVRSLCRLATGRSALFHLIARLPESHAHTVLLPCYVAEGVIKPFLAAGFTVRFYRLTPELLPDEDDVEALLCSGPPGVVFVLVHFFGFSCASSGLSALLTRARAWVINDCAHAPLSRTPAGEPLGSLGDFALYSLNKLLPVCDGALLLSMSGRVDVAVDETALPELPEPALAAYRTHLAACRALFEATTPAQAMQPWAALEAAYEAYYNVINNDLRPHRQSACSRRIEARFPYDETARLRRAHASRLYAELDSEVVKPLHAGLPPHVVPFAVPLRVAAARRAELQRILFDRGILLSTLTDKWNFVPPQDAQRFVAESSFLAEHLLVPVSEFLTDEDMSRLIRELNRLS